MTEPRLLSAASLIDEGLIISASIFYESGISKGLKPSDAMRQAIAHLVNDVAAGTASLIADAILDQRKTTASPDAKTALAKAHHIACDIADAAIEAARSATAARSAR